MRGMMTNLTPTLFDETPAVLAERSNDGIGVSLLWWRRAGRLVVAVVDEKLNDVFHVDVDPSSAMDVFHHPYAHAAA